jgi:hypothetical protein
MVKRAKKATKPPKKAAGSARSAKGSSARTHATPRPKTSASARSKPLPGMEQARDRVLDNAHEQIAEGRSLMASGRELEQEGMGVALQQMQKLGLRAYRHAGIESAFVPGVDKLRVRQSKDAEHAVNEPRETQGGDNPPPPAEFDDDGNDLTTH